METRASRRRWSLASLVAGVSLLAALVSAVHSGPHVWRTLGAEHHTYQAYTSSQDEHAFLAALSLDSQAFDFFAAHVKRGDRFYFQVPPATAANVDLLAAAVAASSFYLLPAVRTTELSDANVVVSYGADPRSLGVQLASEVSDGRRPFFVSVPRPK